MKHTLILVALLGMTGCSSLNQAGTASYSVKPFMAGDRPVCCEVTVNNGKEIASLDALVEKRGDDYTVHLVEHGVVAFEGQRIAAGAAKTAATSAAKAAAVGGLVVAAPILAPMAGAALAAPGLGAAAAGAGALAVGQQLAK